MERDKESEGYRGLRTQVAGILQEGRNRAARAVERELVRAYWQVGDVLHRHLLGKQERAGYGEQLMAQLSSDLEIRKQRLYEMLKFRRCFPKVRARGLLGWSHYKSVLVLPEYWNTGVVVLLLDEMAKRAAPKGYKWADLSITSEDNPQTPILATRLGATLYKRWRVYRLWLDKER